MCGECCAKAVSMRTLDLALILALAVGITLMLFALA
jgi:hypothetical protein